MYFIKYFCIVFIYQLYTIVLYINIYVIICVNYFFENGIIEHIHRIGDRLFLSFYIDYTLIFKSIVQLLN